jgi:arsenite-transporting ATPase
MARIILYSGKGGVGKTTMAAAAGLALAERGYRTLVISFDLAHSLTDSYNLERTLFDQNEGLPVQVTDRLDLQEINIQSELDRYWGEVAKYFTVLIASTGVGDLVAEELAIIPGMEDVVCLLYLNQYVKDKTYDVLVVDCPPTSESVRFVSMGTTLRWYMEQRFGIDRQFFRVIKPLSKLVKYGALPDDDYFKSIKGLYERVQGVEELLADPKITSVRLVTNPEKMVVKETQRAFLYFTLYGLTIDSVIVNRLLTNSKGFFAQWAATHATHVREIENYFEPVPVTKVPFFPDEIVGLQRLREMAAALFGDSDPAGTRMGGVPFGFEKRQGVYRLKMPVPFVAKDEVHLVRQDSNLIITIGSYKRYVPLPRSVNPLEISGARLEEGQLVVTFGDRRSTGGRAERRAGSTPRAEGRTSQE